MSRPARICVLGGSGAMGRVVVKCLLKASSSVKITVADRRPPRDKFPSRVKFSEINLLHHASLTRLLKKHDVVINSTSHHFNLPVMRAAFAAGTKYLDLGGLFHFTRKQLKLNSKFKKKNVLAVLGMGCAPGVANLLAAWAAKGMDQVSEIHIKVGGRSWDPPTTDVPYAIGTIREELTWKPAIVTKGKYHFAPPMSGKETFNFPKPVGKQRIFRTIHSEVATLPISFPGVKESSFKIGFSDAMIDVVLHPRKYRKPVAPVSKPVEAAATKPHDAEITAAVVMGKIGKKKVTRVASYISKSSGEHCAGDWNTAWPPALVSLMMANGEVDGAGVYPPEKIVPYEKLFTRLKKFGFRFQMQPR